MKNIKSLFSQVSFVAVFILFGQTVLAQDQPASPPASTNGTVDGVSVAINYSSPGVKERVIFGGLEPWGKVWRAGANNTTTIEFDKDVSIGGKKIPAGKYGLYMIPNEDEDWVVIINTDWDREKHGAWGAYNYKEDNDVARITVSPKMVNESMERLKYEVTKKGFDFGWAKVRLSVPIKKS